jgi:hypothetical protein
VRGARRALLLLAITPFLFAQPAAAEPERAVLVFLMDVGYEEAAANGVLRSLAATGGIGLLTETEEAGEVTADLRATAGYGDVTVSRMSPPHIGNQLSALLPSTLFPGDPDRDLLVLAFSPDTPPGTAPIILGRGTIEELHRNPGPLPGLTSSTTGRPGLVANVDLVPTILEFLGQPIPEDAAGNAIRVEGQAPTELHRTYVEYREVVTPVGLLVLGLALAALAVGLALILGPWRPPAGVARAIALVGLFAVSLQVGMLAGSWLPDLSWGPWPASVRW